MKYNKFHPSSWLALGCLTWLQVINGTPGCWPLMHQHYHISHVQLNYILVASETGKLFGFLSNIVSDYLAPWKILLIGMVFVSVGYCLQYFYIAYNIPCLSYSQILLLNALTGNGTCWINKYIYSVAVRNFSDSHKIFLTLTSSYSSLSGKIYASLFIGIRERNSPKHSPTFLLFVCFVIVTVGLTTACINTRLYFPAYGNTKFMFPVVFAIIPIMTGVYVVIQNIVPIFVQMSPRLKAVIFVLILMLPSAIGVMLSIVQFIQEKCQSQLPNEQCKSSLESVSRDVFNIEIEKERDHCADNAAAVDVENGYDLKVLPFNVNFWLFYLVSLCGATLAAVYLNHLERISNSRSNSGNEEAPYLLPTSFAFGFFGKISSDMMIIYTRKKCSRINSTAWTVFLMMPMPLAFFLLIGDGPEILYISTGILGTCSGALNAINASTRELVGCKNSIVKTTIVLTNVPIGFLIFGYLAAINYDKQSDDGIICRGQHCYYKTFIIWGSICFVGTLSSFLLHLRTQKSL